MRNAVVVLIACGLSLLELEPLLTDRDFRQRMLQQVEDPLVVSFFQHQYDRWGREQPIFVSPVLNKVSAFLFKPQVRYMLGADDNALDFRRIIDEGKILVINLGCFRDEETQRLLGSLFLTSLEQAAFSRSNQPPHARRPFFCMVDEFPLFCARDQTSLARILSECRKYRLHLGLAHQTIAQLPGQRIQGALENAKLKVIFGTGRQTAEAIARELYMPDPKAIKHEVVDETAKERTHPVFSALDDQFEVFTQSVQQLRRRRALVKLPDKATVAHVRIPKVPASRLSAGQLERLKQALAKDVGRPCQCWRSRSRAGPRARCAVSLASTASWIRAIITWSAPKNSGTRLAPDRVRALPALQGIYGQERGKRALEIALLDSEMVRV